MFLIDLGDEVARKYNDVSPLENMHCARLLDIVLQDRCRVFGHLPRREFQGLRKMIIDAILNTDASQHDAVLAQLQALYDLNSDEFDAERRGQGFTKPQLDLLGTDTNRRLVSRALLLGSDESSQSKPWRTAYAWAELLRDELVAEGDRERAMGFPVAPINDRCAMSLSEAQLGRLHLLAAPLLAAQVRLFRNWAPLTDTMAANIREWGSRLAKESMFDPAGRAPDTYVKTLCDLLAAAGTIVHRSGGKFVATCASAAGEEVVANEPCSEPSCPEVPAAPLVREIRRWRENQTMPGQQRELVLLYIVSDEGAGQRDCAGQPVLYRYAVQGPDGSAHFGSSPSSGGSSLLPPSASPKSSAPVSGPAICGPKAPGVVSFPAAATVPSSQSSRPHFSDPQAAQAWCESTCRQLDSGKFETLLGAVLEDLPDILHPELPRQPT